MPQVLCLQGFIDRINLARFWNLSGCSAAGIAAIARCSGWLVFGWRLLGWKPLQRHRQNSHAQNGYKRKARPAAKKILTSVVPPTNALNIFCTFGWYWILSHEIYSWPSFYLSVIFQGCSNVRSWQLASCAWEYHGKSSWIWCREE